MKLFIWQHVLTDYTDGMICALAEDLGHAATAVEMYSGYPDDEQPHASRTVAGEMAQGEPDHVIDLGKVEHAPPAAMVWYVHGGG